MDGKNLLFASPEGNYHLVRDGKAPPDLALRDRLFDDAYLANVQVAARKQWGHGAFSTGSGFFIDNGQTIMTNAHVVRGAHEHHVILNNGTLVHAKLQTFDPVKDIATLRLDPVPTKVLEIEPTMARSKNPAKNAEKDLRKPLSFSQLPLKEGESVYAFGHPHGVSQLVESGGRYVGMSSYRKMLAEEGFVVTGRDPRTIQRVDSPMLKISNLVLSGNSGGPLVDESGKVAGMVTSSLNDYSSGGAIPASILEDHIKNADKLKIEYTPFQASYASSFMSDLSHNPLRASANVGFGIAAGRDFLPLLRENPKILGFVSAAAGGILLCKDLDRFDAALTKEESIQATMASVFDASLIVGGAGMLSKNKAFWLGFMGAAAGGRVLTDFMPTGQYVKDLEPTREWSINGMTNDAAILSGSLLYLFGKNQQIKKFGVAGMMIGGVNRVIEPSKKSSGLDISYWQWQGE